MRRALTRWQGRLRRLLSGLATRRGRRALRWGVAAAVEHQPLLRRLDPALVVDVGANRGQFALAVVATCPRAEVVSFEPLAGEAEVYRDVMAGATNVRLVRAAVSDAPGRRSIHVTEHADSSSLNAPTQLQTSIFPGTAEVGAETVDVTTLDQALGELDVPADALLKLDVQGHELDVLRGAAAVLDRFRWVYLEASFVELYEGQALAHEIIAHLAERGFVLRDLGMPTRAGGRTVQVDLLFERGVSGAGGGR